MGSITSRSADAGSGGMPQPEEVWQGSVKLARADDNMHLTVLLRAIEHDIIPKLMLAHRGPAECLEMRESTGPAITEADVELFARLVLSPDDVLAHACILTLRGQGVTAEAICLDLLAPVARRLGQLWEQDLCDFAEVTLGLGRLQQALRDLSPSFVQASGSPANGHRILLAPGPGEQHTFGLVMVAEFFRRAGWDVEPMLGPTVYDPLAVVKREWYDVVGFSLGAEIHLDELAGIIGGLRKVSLNPRVGIMVGGPLFAAVPQHVQYVGADICVTQGRDAPAMADQLIANKMAAGSSKLPPS